MHELSICGSIVDIVNRHAAGRPVETVHLRIGKLRQIVPDTLAYCWSLVTEDTPLAGATLAVEHVPATLDCRTCGHRTELRTDPTFRCAGCGGTDVGVATGEEFLLTSLELAEGVNT